MDDRSGSPRVVLLRDRRWPAVPGVCCWRHGCREAFRAAGAVIDEATFDASPTPARTGGAGRRMDWLPSPARRPLARAYRLSRRLSRVAMRRAPRLATRERPIPISGDLRDAVVVVCESLEAADAVVRAGVPPRRVWALALPAEWIRLGDDSPYTQLLARVAAEIGGLLTDSETARDSVERAAASTRPRVEIFPPLAVDRPCPSCVGTAPAAALPDEVPAEVAQLAAWRSILWGAAAAPAYSFPLARLRGSSGPWAPAARKDWTQVSATSAVRGPAVAELPNWLAEAQERATHALLGEHVRAGARTTPRRILVSGYDLKFIRELAGRLDARPDLEVTLDEWTRIGAPTSRSDALVGAADSIVAEWARPNAALLSRRKGPGQHLIVRLHRFELETPYPRDVDIDAVDAVVHVSPPIRWRIIDELGWPDDKLVYIPNFLDTDWLDRPKLPGARFGIGLVGIEFANKRFDHALDILTEVRRQDPRFTLFVRSRMPWDNQYAWSRPAEREFAGWCLERIEQDPLLRGAVVFDSPGRDMARWYRRIGQVLSMSDIESFHLAVAEGMASGAVPVIRPWPGSSEIYDKEWIHVNPSDAAAAVLANADEEVWAERAARARAEIVRTANPAAVIQAWADLLHGDLTAARSHFQEYALATARPTRARRST
jgi:glycosyltransferase involved in cell wall biosynthesis